MDLDNLLGEILTTDDCQHCRLCCYFHDDDKVDAPLFSASQKKRLLSRRPELQFDRYGRYWKIRLTALAEGRYVCPLLDREKHICTARDINCFDCRTWPFYIMKKDDTLYFTLSKDCPAIVQKYDLAIKEVAINQVLPYMLREVKKNPDLIADYRSGVVKIKRIQNTRK